MSQEKPKPAEPSQPPLPASEPTTEENLEATEAQLDDETVDESRPTVESKPYRHVIANRWLVHALLQYHYLPYWPRNVDQVFATVDIRTGRIVAACVFAYPVLRCFLREQVFGRLTPESLNRDFRQLVRWMVHPDYRDEQVGTALLRWAFTKVQQPVIEAINRDWVPEAVFARLGMIERSDGERHYYYRLKDCRKRVDQIANPPAQVEASEPPVVHAYPRFWRPRVNHHDWPKVLFVQPYEGAAIRVHAWRDELYTVYFDKDVTVEALTAAPAIEEIEAVDERKQAANVLETDLPIAKLN